MTARPQKQAPLRFLILFFFFVLAGTALIRNAWIDENILLPYTRWITVLSATLLHEIGFEVIADGTMLKSGGFAVEIRKGCDGVEATLILLAAFLAYPFRWRRRLQGLLSGGLLIFLLNLIRILVLYWLGQSGRVEAFRLVHTYVAQFAVIAGAMVLWLYFAWRQRPLAT